MQEFVGEYY
jgi:hypothetical protein